jgi:multidrug efflux pump subunit AcrA (membrane-fusion protein)
MTTPRIPHARLSRRGVHVLWPLTLALLGALVAAGCKKHANPPPTPAERAPVEVSLVTPVLREIPRYVRATGTLFGDEETTIAAKVAGRIVEVARDMGDTAAPGDVLVRIDPTDYQLAERERDQAFREALASIGLRDLPAGAFDVTALPGVVRARLQAENAKARYDRGKNLAERKPPLISEQDFADLKTAWEVAESNLGVERLDAEAKLAEARTLWAQVLVARQRVEDSVTRAPALPVAANDSPGGAPADQRRVYEVSARYVSVGDFVQIGTPLCRLVDSNPLKLRASVPERRARVIAVGQEALVSVEPASESFRGTVSRVSPAIDALTRNFAIEVLIPNDARSLKAGAFAIGQILTGRERALMVPEKSVVTFAGVHKVVAVEDGKAREKRIEIGQRDGTLVEVVSGLQEGDRIVAEPTGALATGVPVRVVDRPSASAAPPAEKPGAKGGARGPS